MSIQGIKLIIFTTFMILCFNVFAGDTEKHETSKFSIKFPSSWEIDGSGKMGTAFILYGPKPESDGAFREHLYLSSQKLPTEGITIKDYKEAAELQLKQQVENYTSEYSKVTTHNGAKCVVTRYSGKQSESKLEWKQYYFIINETAYILTYTSEQKDFEDKITQAQKIIDSFQFKDE